MLHSNYNHRYSRYISVFRYISVDFQNDSLLFCAVNSDFPHERQRISSLGHMTGESYPGLRGFS